MPDHPETGVFLEKRSYRRRRLVDALKSLPFAGAWLFLLPVFWPGGEDDAPRAMSAALYYVFGAWLVLIVMSAALIRSTRRSERPDESHSAPGQDGAGEASDP